jgi:hypothetical protein
VNIPCPKLAIKYFGPYNVLEQIREAAYKLDLPEGCLVHPVFHVSQLKSFTLDYIHVFQDLPPPPQLDTVELKPEQILEQRLSTKGNTMITQVMIKWSSLPSAMATYGKTIMF